MFQSWRFRKEHEQATLKRLFDTASAVPLGREAVDFLENQHSKIKFITYNTSVAQKRFAAYNAFNKSISLYVNAQDIPGSADLVEFSSVLVHEIRHAWQDKNGLIKKSSRLGLADGRKIIS
ncbi:MAG: hypothetical protein JWO78_2018 [Micavibrio sp.]|nr:hypothetical protein [Micavibrio sp.]